MSTSMSQSKLSRRDTSTTQSKSPFRKEKFGDYKKNSHIKFNNLKNKGPMKTIRFINLPSQLQPHIAEGKMKLKLSQWGEKSFNLVSNLLFQNNSLQINSLMYIHVNNLPTNVRKFPNVNNQFIPVNSQFIHANSLNHSKWGEELFQKKKKKKEEKKEKYKEILSSKEFQIHQVIKWMALMRTNSYNGQYCRVWDKRWWRRGHRFQDSSTMVMLWTSHLWMTSTSGSRWQWCRNSRGRGVIDLEIECRISIYEI